MAKCHVINKYCVKMLFYFNFRGNLLFFASKTEIHKQKRAK